MQDYIANTIRFVLWCAGMFGIRWLCELTPAMAEGFVSHLRSLGRSPATVASYVAAIRKLDVGLREVVGWRKGQPPLLGDDYSGRHADLVADPFSAQDAQRLIDALARRDPQYATVALLQRISGLRVLEAVHLEARLIAPDGAQIQLYGRGIHTKGGRERVVPILPHYQSQLLEFRASGLSHADGHLFVHRQTLDGAVKREVSRLGRKLGINQGSGSHSFRKLYATELFDYAANQLRLPHKDVLQMVTEALGHRRHAVLVSYIDSGRLHKGQ